MFPAANSDHNPLSASALQHGPPPPYESLMLSRQVTAISARVARSLSMQAPARSEDTCVCA